MKIIFLGDSLTAGVYGGDFVAELAAMMPDDEIINAGVGGSTAPDMLARLDAIIAAAPDAVFLMGGGNDAISYSQPETRPYYRQAQDIADGVVTPEMFTAAYRDILQALQLAFVRVWVGLPPMEYNPQTVAAMKRYNDIAREVAASFNVPALDLMAHFAPDAPPERPPITIKTINTIGQRTANGWDDYEGERERGGFTYTFDGIHILPRTAGRFARLIYDFIHD